MVTGYAGYVKKNTKAGHARNPRSKETLTAPALIFENFA